MKKHFGAPWSTRLKLLSAAFVVLLVIVFFVTDGLARYVVLAILLATAALAVRGYSVIDGQLLVHRLGWATKFDLEKLTSAEVSPGATMGSVRALGIGGLFGFVGHFRNEVLGLYKAYATNEHNTVVLDFGGDKVVVTPGEPHEFVEAVSAWAAQPTPKE
jgi:hypothetical protein